MASTQKPGSPKAAVGRIVHVFVDPAANNGADVAPAMITRVWSDRMVNVRVIRDNALADATDWKTSITLFPARKDAEVDFEQLCQKFETPPARPHAGFWPERV